MSENELPVYSTLADDEDLQDIVVLFVDEMPDRIARFQEAFLKKDRSELIRIVHQFKGSAGSHGFMELSRVAVELEDAIKSDSPDEEIASALQKLIDLCRRATSKPKPT